MRQLIVIAYFVVWGSLSLMAAPSAAEESWRVSVGGGYGVGSNNGTYDVNHGTLDLESVTGGSGPVLTANLWADRLLFSDLSIGVEFLRLMNSGTASLDLPKGISILTDPTNGQAKLSATADMAFLDFAYRPSLNDPRFAFSVGAGIGGGMGKASAGFTIYNPALGGFSQQSSVKSPIGGVHGMMGADFYLTKSFFISLAPQILYMTGHPIGVRQSYLDMMVTSSVGYSF